MPFAVTLRCGPEEAELLLAECMDFDTTGVEADVAGLVAHFDAQPEAARFAAHFHSYQPQLEEIEARNWASEWQQHWRPLTVGQRFYLSPSWITEPAPDGRILLEMRPGLVFGGGDHPTTQLCLEFLEQFVRPGAVMADIGCGSGILSDAASKLGAGKVIACDIEFAAAEAARAVLGADAPVYCGSVDALRPGQCDVVAANLLTGIVTALLPRLAGALRPGGVLVTSGFLSGQEDAIDARAKAQGLRKLEGKVLGDWASGVYQL